MAEGYPVYVRMPAELELRLNQIAVATGYSKSKVVRKLLAGALDKLELGETRRELVIALSRWSRVK